MPDGPFSRQPGRVGFESSIKTATRSTSSQGSEPKTQAENHTFTGQLKHHLEKTKSVPLPAEINHERIKEV
jgi:hypothetical protein